MLNVNNNYYYYNCIMWHISIILIINFIFIKIKAIQIKFKNSFKHLNKIENKSIDRCRQNFKKTSSVTSPQGFTVELEKVTGSLL